MKLQTLALLLVECAGAAILISSCEGCTGKGMSDVPKSKEFPGEVVDEIYLKDGTRCVVLRDLNEPHVSGMSCDWKE